ncbi:MAG: hypothetical protein FJ264_13780 [Planctomycetes bacterium]|nr:hypothetical protein [Planctomycetota bacterium]
MKLTESQLDTLKEISNIGVSRAATQLSTLLNDEIVMRVPEIYFLPVDEAVRLMPEYENVSVVYQDLKGDFSGRAHLVFHNDESRLLVHALIGTAFTQGSEDMRRLYETETMMEIGNIVISTCISTFANLLKNEIVLTTPTYTELHVSKLFDRWPEDTVSMIIETTLCASKRDVTGTLLIMLTIGSAKNLLIRIADFCQNIE